MANKKNLFFSAIQLEERPILSFANTVSDDNGKFVCTFGTNISDVDFLVQFYYNNTIVKEIILTDQNEESSVDAFTLSYEDQVSILIFKKNLTPAGPEILCTISSISLSV